jgi:hypothetical protein
MGQANPKHMEILVLRVYKINNGYLCSHGPDTWFFAGKVDLVGYIADQVDEIP